MNWDLSQFHFIRPLWLLAIPLALLLWLLISRSIKTTYWESHLSKPILEALRVNTSKQSSLGRWLLLLGWITALLAAAGPTWQKQPVPSFQNSSAMVIVLDLSISMLAEDLTPNRLAQAKYKLIDILRARRDGQTALIAYSGDAHTVTPLTDDPVAIEALLPALHPNIMPIKGSNTEDAIELAIQLLSASGNSNGEILLLTDGVSSTAENTIESLIGNSYSLSILGVGKTEPTPIPVQGGGFLRSESGEIILSSIDNQQLTGLAARTNGRYRQISVNDADINSLISDEFEAQQQNSLSNNLNNSTLYDSWVDMGHWLALLLIPFVALCFRKGVIYLLPLCFLMPVPEANALTWQDLWLTKDQQAQKLLEQDPEAAAETFERQDWSGVANYQAKNYKSAADNFSAGDSASDHYNRGNALALTGDLQAALSAYQNALDIDSEFADAQHNKEIIEELIQQQEQQQQNQQGQNSENQDSDGSQEQQADGSQEQQADGSEQQQADGSEQQQAEGSEDQQAEGSEDQQAEGSQDQQAEGSQDQQAKGSEQQQVEGSEDQQADGSQEQQAHGSQEQQAEGSQEQQAEGSEENADNSEQSSAFLSEATPEQLQDSSEQWLRGIQDDPSGLLRRKFEYQTWQRSRQSRPTQPNAIEERY
ncbi:MAG: VWA domain-containing protein [Acidiferrobacterales bacterium]|nr:VWA domain-containing protein [Acidiferrobacterales bacterium]